MQYRLDDLLVDLSHRRITRNGEVLTLPDLSWRVFAALLDKAPDAVSFSDLASIAWQRDHVSADTLSQRIKLLRQTLGDDPAAPRYIATERGVGYRLAAAPETVAPRAAWYNKKRKWLPWAFIPALFFLPFISGKFFTQQPPAPAGAAVNASVISISDLVNQGSVYLARGSYDDNENALRLFRQALDLEPQNVRAMIGVSFALSHRATKYDFGSQAAIEAQTLAERATEVSPQSAATWHALGFAKDAQGLISEALRAYQQAIAIDPSEVSAIASAAYLLQIQGRFHEALLLERQALDNGAATLFSYLQIATALQLAGLDDDADAWLKRAETLTPDNLLLKDIQAEYYLTLGDFTRVADIAAPNADIDRRAALDVRYGEAMLALNKVDEARTAFRAARERDENDTTGAFELAALEYRLGERQNAIPADDPLIIGLREDRQAGDEWPETAVAGAFIYASAGDDAGANEFLCEAYRLGYRNHRRLKYSPFFATTRDNPAFSALLAEMEADAAAQRLLIRSDQRLSSFLTSAPGPALPKPEKSP